MLQTYLQLLRLPNIFTAMADVAMGFLFVHVAWAWEGEGPLMSLRPVGAWTLGLLVAASSLLYAAGVVLNDVFDVERDRDERPDRPLPSGRISLRTARRLGWNLLSVGTLVPCGVAVILARYRPAQVPGLNGQFGHLLIVYLPAVVAIALAATIVLYNGLLKRTVLGPVAMGACRMLNVLLGMSVLREPLGVPHWIIAGGVGVYVAGITWFARDDARRSDRRKLSAATLVMLVGVAMVGSLPGWSGDLWLREQEMWRWYVLIAAIGVLTLVWCAWAIGEPSPGPVRMTVARSIISLVFIDAAICYASCGPYWAIPVALLVLPATFLGKWIEAT